MEDILVVVGTVVHALSPSKITIHKKAAIAVQNGKIVNFEETGNTDLLISGIKKKGKILVRNLANHEFLCPGLVDMHFHACQYPNLGIGLSEPLLEWLEKYTFPLEARYADVEFAKCVYTSVVKATLACGSTTVCYFATVHPQSTLMLAQVAGELGQRALIGKVNMNRNSTPVITETTEKSLSDTKSFIEKIQSFQNPLIQPVITPRFAISCDMELMKGLAKLAKDNNLHIQTHISENKEEVEFAKELFPTCTDYTDIYLQAGLLTNKTILAHGVYLSADERRVIAENGSSIAHCPNSNTHLLSGECDVRALLHSGVKVGLGTDVAGGCDASILDAMRGALSTSIHISFRQKDYTPLNYHEVFYLATVGGAKGLRMDDHIGTLEIGKDFDALVIDMSAGVQQGVFSFHSTEELVHKFIYTGSSQNIKSVYVNGRLVKNVCTP